MQRLASRARTATSLRKRCEEALVRQIKHALKPCEGNFAVHRTYGRVFVECLSDYEYSEVTEALSRVFGISGICPIVEVPVVSIEELREAAAAFMKEEYPSEEATFKVHARRLNKEYPLDSMRVNEELGEAVLMACPHLTVDVHKPQIMLHVEIREKIYIYSHIIPGPGGLPVGVGGKAMLLLSGGIDSPVAGYIYQRARAAEGRRSGEPGGRIYRPHLAPQHQLHGDPALHL